MLFVVYVCLNHYFLNLVGDTDRTYQKRENLLNLPKQLESIKSRINQLQKSLDDSKSNANLLNDLIKRANSDLKDTPTKKKADKIAVLVFACNRAQTVDKHLRLLFERRNRTRKIEKFPIIVSQDCGHEETARAIEAHRSSLFAILKQPDLSDITHEKNGKEIPVHMRGYFKIARHYKYALDKIFMDFQFQSVIITEDDLNLAVDFFHYFEAMYSVMLSDPSIFCTSAWNDNGKEHLIETGRPDLVHRTDFFPGLGWMMLRSLWLEYKNKWPSAFWDDWVREPSQRKDRVCLRPEVSRTQVSGLDAKAGVSAGQFFDKYLQFIRMNQNEIDWSKLNNNYLIKTNYDEDFLVKAYNKTTELTLDTYLKTKHEYSRNKTSILITYNTKDEFVKYAKHFGIMSDFKAGVPRTGYKGVVRIFHEQNLIYIAPSSKYAWTSYPKDW